MFKNDFENWNALRKVVSVFNDSRITFNHLKRVFLLNLIIPNMICSIENRHVGLDERKKQFPASGGIFSCIVLCAYIIFRS